MSPEEAAWEADRKWQKEFETANAAERDRRIAEIFEGGAIFSIRESWGTSLIVAEALRSGLMKHESGTNTERMSLARSVAAKTARIVR
jgi:hypothetical protein